MLVSLRIQNLALVEDLTLPLEAGFTVLTGETGAGKSLLVDALALLLGARGDSELVRAGSERAIVEGVVDGAFEAWAAFLEARGLPSEQPVVLRREVSTAGRSRAWINGAACSLTDLREAGRLWIRLTSQHDHQNLLAEERHLGLLDELLGCQITLDAEVEALRQAMQALRERQRGEQDREARLATLAEHLSDLERLAPKPGDWAHLRSEREPLRHAAQLQAAWREAAESFDQALPQLEAAQRALTRILPILPEAQGDGDRLRSLLLEAEDLAATARDQALHWSRMGSERLEAVEERLAHYERLARRHRCEPEDLPSLHRALEAERRDLLEGDRSLAELEARLQRAAEAYVKAAADLHARRAERLPVLEREVHRRLKTLGMGGARLQARLGLAEDPSSPALHQGRPMRIAPSGFSTLTFWIEPNPGEGFRPLAKVASGGELSRLMLALQGAGMALAPDADAGLTLVLDEVDAGIGGETALAVGAAIRDLGRRHQVLAVTHLAQVAARADHHGCLTKETRDGRTRSHLTWVQGEARLRELARLLSGHPDRPEALAHARSLLASS